MASQQFVWNSNNQSSSESSSEDEAQVFTKRRKILSWKTVSTFENLELAKEFIATKKEYRYFKTYDTGKNQIRNYTCRQSKSCSSKWRLVCCNQSLGHPSTNNGLEATNRWIKTQGTLRNKLPIAKMMEFILNQIKNWSVERDPDNPNCKAFMQYATITLPLETAAFQWIERKPDVKFRTCPTQSDSITYCISANRQPKLKEDDIILVPVFNGT